MSGGCRRMVSRSVITLSAVICQPDPGAPALPPTNRPTRQPSTGYALVCLWVAMPVRLVSSQGIHWVDDERLDAAFAGLPRPRTVVQQRIDKAFCFAAAGARRHQGV